MNNKIVEGTRVRIIKLANEEERYNPGDKGTVSHIDDLGQIHVKWDLGGSIALIPGEDKFERIESFKLEYTLTQIGTIIVEGTSREAALEEIENDSDAFPFLEADGEILTSSLDFD